MTGKINATSSKKIPIIDIKDLSKKNGCTVNDIVMIATSAALKQYFKAVGDPMGMLEDSDSRSFLNVSMPTNIRW